MTQINLLPWREQQREERKREFLTMLVGFIIIAGGLVFLVDRYFVNEIDNQQARNQYLKTEITQLDAQVAEISELRSQKEEIRSRMNVITSLQGTRPVIVRVFDDLVRTLPQGVYYNSLQRKGNSISISGVAESYARLTELMRRLDRSPWFKNAALSETTATRDVALDRNAANAFSLNLALELPSELIED